MTPKLDPIGPASPETRRVLVVFESAATRKRALQFCNDLASHYHPRANLEVAWFAFESLNEPPQSDQAVAKACDADVIVFAVQAAGDLPQVCKLWIERWLGKRSQHEGALVGLVVDRSRNAGDAACLKEVYLRHITQRAGMDYLSGETPTAIKAIPDSLDSYNERAGQVTAVLDQILQAHPATVPRIG